MWVKNYVFTAPDFSRPTACLWEVHCTDVCDFSSRRPGGLAQSWRDCSLSLDGIEPVTPCLQRTRVLLLIPSATLVSYAFNNWGESTFRSKPNPGYSRTVRTHSDLLH